MYNYAGQVAVVTGAAMGIGRAIARKLVAEGCHVALWDKNAEALSGAFADLSASGSVSTMRLNVFGTFNCCHAVVPSMVLRKSGRIINLSSWFGKVGRPSSLAYCASKFAILGMTQSMALDLAAHGIRVNAVCPGAIANTQMRDFADTQLAARGLPTAAERAHTIPLGRLGEPEDVANVVAFLLSSQADYMTGQGINVTGGVWMN
jgi:NAD(P)-dependent dehydrogenase (short-subunit alcohol dehydrogenase family)